MLQVTPYQELIKTTLGGAALALDLQELTDQVTNEAKKAPDRLYDSGLIDPTQAHDLASVGETGLKYSPIRAKVMAAMS